MNEIHGLHLASSVISGVARSNHHEPGAFATVLDAIERRIQEIQGAPLPPHQPPCPEGFHWIGQGFDTCEGCGLPAWEHNGRAVLAAGQKLFQAPPPWQLDPWAPGDREKIAARWLPRLLERNRRIPPAANRCDPGRDRHVEPHRACVPQP